MAVAAADRRTTSMRDLCTIAFGYFGLNPNDHITTRSDLIRPAEVDVLLGDSSKARPTFGWTPETSLEAMLAEMVDTDLARHRARMAASNGGFNWKGFHQGDRGGTA